MVLYRAVVVLTFFVFVSGCAGFGKTTGMASDQHAAGVEAAKSDATPYQDMMKKAGYLSAEALPDSGVLLPEPPAEGTEAMAYDEAVNRKYWALRDSPRWNQAAIDADLSFPDAFEGFSCILNVPITEEATPGLYRLLRRVALDAGKSTRVAKEKYKRPRPFLVNNEPICTPEEQGALMFNGSYPSGHSAVGWAWALVLAELSPEQSDTILARGRDFGESRLICNVHWQSDVVEGRFMASCAVARLHGEPAFRADMETARAEIQAARAKGLKPSCH